MPKETKAASKPKKKASAAKPKKKATKAKRISKGLNKWGLTLKQEKFCREYIANGGDATAAYKAAYNTEDMAIATIWVKACELKYNGTVAVRLSEHRDKISEKFQIGQVVQKQIFMEVVKRGLKSSTVLNSDGEPVDTGEAFNLSAVVSATDKLVRMEGNYPKGEDDGGSVLVPVSEEWLFKLTKVEKGGDDQEDQ